MAIKRKVGRPALLKRKKGESKRNHDRRLFFADATEKKKMDRAAQAVSKKLRFSKRVTDDDEEDTELVEPVMHRSAELYEPVLGRKRVSALVTAVVPRDDQTREEWDEQQVARCERFMIQGYRTPAMIRKMMNRGRGEHSFTTQQVKRYIARVEARWEVLGSNNDLRKLRGEELQRVDAMESRLWQMIEDRNTSNRERVVIMSMIARLASDRRELNGLSEDGIKQAMTTQEDSAFTESVKRQKGVARAAERFLEFVREKKAQKAEEKNSSRKRVKSR